MIRPVCLTSLERERYREDLMRQLRQVLSPAQYATLVLLFGLGDEEALPYAEIANRLNISVYTVYDRREQALKKLKARSDICDLLRACIPTDRLYGMIHSTSSHD